MFDFFVHVSRLQDKQLFPVLPRRVGVHPGLACTSRGSKESKLRISYNRCKAASREVSSTFFFRANSGSNIDGHYSHYFLSLLP